MWKNKSANLLWLSAYLVLMIFLISYVLRLRDSQTASLSEAEAQQQWQKWREEATQIDESVKRRRPKSPEPPGLVLLRDHFPVVMAAAVVFGSALFLMSMVVVRGVFSRGPGTQKLETPASQADEPRD